MASPNDSEAYDDFADIVKSQQTRHDQMIVLKRNYSKTPSDRRTRGYVQKRIENLDSLWYAFREDDSVLRKRSEYDISTYCTKSVYDITDDYYSVFSGELFDAMDNLNSIPARAVDSEVRTPQTSPFRLPQITLPTFSGDYASWSAFSDMFVSLIHTNPALTNVQKLHYLKSNLRGAAASVLRNTKVTNENYAIAWKSLEERFANKKVLVEAQLKLLLNQPSQHIESLDNIRDIIDITQESLNALQG